MTANARPSGGPNVAVSTRYSPRVRKPSVLSVMVKIQFDEPRPSDFEKANQPIERRNKPHAEAVSGRLKPK
jgi:hypothetical protein